MKRRSAHVALLLLAAGLVAVLTRLGFWQLERAAQKAAQQTSYQSRSAAAPVAAEDLLSMSEEPGELRFRRAEVSGRYVPEKQFLLDNRTQGGVAGYHVYTAFETEAVPARPVLLVNRGWVPVGPRRDQLPDIVVDAARRVVRGTVELPRTDLFVLGDTGYEQRVWPRVVQRLDPLMAASSLGRPVAAVVLLLDADQDDGFSRNWTPYLGISPDRHRGYAVQWFALAATLVVITVSLSWRSRRNGRRS